MVSKNKERNITGKKLDDLFDNYDFFATPMSSLNIDGKEQVGTSIGFICSFIVGAICLIFAFTKG